MLYLIPTPIGNLSDMTFRGVQLLKEVDLILAEDTRTSGKLLKHYEIETPMRSYHMHNEHKATEGFVQLLSQGQKIALISDAGTPGISDPGFFLIRAAKQENIIVECLPGASAFVPALVQSGLPCDRFHFEGFLPVKKGKQTRLKYLAGLEHTFVLYVSPHKLLKNLQELIEFCGEARQASLSREISKLHHETVDGTLSELHKEFSSRSSIKGEIVLVVAGNN